MLETIAKWVPIGLSVLFILILFGHFLIGMQRGFKKSLFYLAVWAVFIVLFLLFLDTITAWVITIKIPFINQTIPNFLLDLLKGQSFYESIASGPMYSLFIGVLSSVVKVVLVILFFLVFGSFIRLLITPLLYHLFGIFLPFIKDKPKQVKKAKVAAHEENEAFEGRKLTRKNKHQKVEKHKWFGGLVGLVPGFIAASLLFVPLNYIVSNAKPATSINRQLKLTDSFGFDSEGVDSIVNGYFSSVPGFAYSAIKDKNGIQITNDFVSSLGSINTDYGKINFLNDINVLMSFADSYASALKGVDLQGDPLITISKLGEEIYKTEENLNKYINATDQLKKITLIEPLYLSSVDYFSFQKSEEKLESNVLSDFLVDEKGIREIKLADDIVGLIKLVIKILPLFENINAQSDLITNLQEQPEYIRTFIDGVLDLSLTEVGLSFGFEQFSSMDSELSKIYKEATFTNEEIKEDIISLTNIVVDILYASVDAGIKVGEIFSSSSIKIPELLLGFLDPILDSLEPLLSLNIYQKVDREVTNYLATHYIDGDPVVGQFIRSSDITVLYNDDEQHGLRKELFGDGTPGNNGLIQLIKNLAQTDLVKNLDFSGKSEDTVLNQVLNGFDATVINIIAEGIDSSRFLQNVLSNYFETLVNTFDMDLLEYHKILNKDGFSWGDELSFLGELSLSLNFGAIMLKGEFNEIPISLLDTLVMEKTNEGSTDKYYVIDSLHLIPRIFAGLLKIEKDGMLEPLAVLLKSNDIGRELKHFVNIIKASNAPKTDALGKQYLDISTIGDDFMNSLNVDLLNVIASELAEGSNFIPKILNNAIGNSLSDYVVVSDWNDVRWSTELSAISYVFLEGQLVANSSETLDIAHISDKFSSIKIIVIDKIGDQVGFSLLFQGVLKKELGSIMNSSTTGPYDYNQLKGDGSLLWDSQKWQDEVKALYRSLYFMVDDPDAFIDLQNLMNFEEIKLSFLQQVKVEIENSIILQHALTSPLYDFLNKPGEEVEDPANWANISGKWFTEVNALVSLVESICIFNDSNTVNIKSPDDLLPKDALGNLLIPLVTLAAIRDSFNTLTNLSSVIIKRQMTGPVNDISGDPDFIVTYLDNPSYNEAQRTLAWHNEIGALYNVGETLSFQIEGHDGLDLSGKDSPVITSNLGMDDVTLYTLKVLTLNIEDSNLLIAKMRPIFDDNLLNMNPSTGDGSYKIHTLSTNGWLEEGEDENYFGGSLAWTNHDFKNELTALFKIAIPLSDLKDGESATISEYSKAEALYWLEIENSDVELKKYIMNIDNPNTDSIRVEVIRRLNQNIDNSWICKGIFRQIGMPIVDKEYGLIKGDEIYDDYWVHSWGIDNDWGINQWNYQLSSLTAVIEQFDSDSEGRVDTSSFSNGEDSEIRITALNAIGQYENCTAILRGVVLKSDIGSDNWQHWPDTYNAYLSTLYESDLANEIDGTQVADRTLADLRDVYWENNQWSDEIRSITEVAQLMETYPGSGKIDLVHGLDFNPAGEDQSQLNLSIFITLSNVIYRSTFLQKKLAQPLFKYYEDAAGIHKSYLAPNISYDPKQIDYINPGTSDYRSYGKQWEDEVYSLYYLLHDTNFDREHIVLSQLTADLEDSSKSLDLKILKNASEIIYKSTYLQLRMGEYLFEHANVENVSDPINPLIKVTTPKAPQYGYEEAPGYLPYLPDSQEFYEGIYGYQWVYEIESLFNILHGTNMADNTYDEITNPEGYIDDDLTPYVAKEVIKLESLNGILSDPSGLIELQLIQNIQQTVNLSTYLQRQFRVSIMQIVGPSGSNAVNRPEILLELGLGSSDEYLDYIFDFNSALSLDPELCKIEDYWNYEIQSLITTNSILFEEESNNGHFVIFSDINSTLGILDTSTLLSLQDLLATNDWHTGSVLRMMLTPTFEGISADNLPLNGTYYASYLVNGPTDLHVIRGEFIFGSSSSDISDLTYFENFSRALGITSVTNVASVLGSLSYFALLGIFSDLQKKQLVQDSYQNSLLVYQLACKYGINTALDSIF
jgi:hypothetical protein